MHNSRTHIYVQQATGIFIYIQHFIFIFRDFIEFCCRRSVGLFTRAFFVFLMKESNKRRRKQPGKLMAKSYSQSVNLPGARPLMNPLYIQQYAFSFNFNPNSTKIIRHSADMSTDTLVECQSIRRPIYRSRGVQSTHDPTAKVLGCSEGRTKSDEKGLVCYYSIKAYWFFFFRCARFKMF